MNTLAEIDGKHCKIDFTQQECAALGFLAEMGGAMLRDVGGVLSRREQELVRVSLNTIRYKANLASSLMNPANIVTENRIRHLEKPV